MKISTRVELGIVVLADIALHSEDGCTVSTAEIAERQNVSQKYLEQIILGLRQGGFVRGQKGSRGGYVLSRSADMINLSDVLNALDNSILADTCEADEEQSGIRSSVNICLWDKLNEYMRRFTARMTLSDLIDSYRESCGSSAGEMYYI